MVEIISINELLNRTKGGFLGFGGTDDWKGDVEWLVDETQRRIDEDEANREFLNNSINASLEDNIRNWRTRIIDFDRGGRKRKKVQPIIIVYANEVIEFCNRKLAENSAENQLIVRALGQGEDTLAQTQNKLGILRTIYTNREANAANRQAYRFGDNARRVEENIERLGFIVDFKAQADPANAWDEEPNTEVIRWKITSPNGNHYLNGERAARLRCNGWEIGEVRLTNDGGRMEVTLNGEDWLNEEEVNPVEMTKEEAQEAEREEEVETEEEEDSVHGDELKPQWREVMGGPAAGFRGQPLQGDGTNEEDNAIMDAWFALTDEGGGEMDIENTLTAARARALWNNNWEPEDFVQRVDSLRIVHPVTSVNVSGFDAILDLGDKNNLFTPAVKIPWVIGKPIHTAGERAAKLAALINIRDTYPEGDDEERAAWTKNSNRVLTNISLLDIWVILDGPEDNDEQADAKLAALINIRDTYPEGNDFQRKAYTLKETYVQRAIADLTPERRLFVQVLRIITEALERPETPENRGEINAKLAALINIRDTYPEGDGVRREAWRDGDKADNVNRTIARLQTLLVVDEVFNMPEDNDEQADAKLAALINIRDTYPEGNEAEREVLTIIEMRLDNSIGNLIEDDELTVMENALDRPEDEEEEIRARKAEMLRIVRLYPTGSFRQRFVWNLALNGDNADVWYGYLFLAGFRDSGARAANEEVINDDEIINNWQLNSPDRNSWLTGAQAGTAYNNGWENHAEIQILNDGTIQGSLDGGVNWLNVDPTAVTRANAQTAEFLHQFRAQGNNAAAALGQPHHITDANVANYQKHSPNGAHHLTGAQAGTAYNNGWENHAEIRITNTNALEVNTGDGWNVYNPTLGGNTRANYIFLRAFRGAGGRANAAHGVDGHITDANVANYQKHSPNGAHHLTGAQAGTAYNNGWENHAEIQILNDGTIQGSLDGGVNWLNVDPTAVTRANAQTAEFLHQFRAQGNNAAAALGQPHHITDANVANYQKHSPNGAHHLTGAQAGTAYNNGWENHAEIRITNTNALEVNTGDGWNVYNPTLGGNTRANYIFLRAFRGAGGRANAAHGADGHITDANVANYQKHSPNGAHHLTGAQAGTAYNNGWENHAEIQILNDGTIQGSLDGGVNWLNVDPTAVTRANAQTAEFLHQFRAQGNNAAAALGQPHHITDANVANYQKHSPNGAHHLTGAQAGTAYNNGWENHAEIRITNTNALEVNTGDGWNVYNPTLGGNTRANYIFLRAFRGAGGRANAAHGVDGHITDANVANYQKHSPNGAHHLTGAQAGTAYNNGWENHAEIQILNDGTIQGSLDGGVNWLNVDPTAVTRANAQTAEFLHQFRAQGNNAAAALGQPHHITDANVANYQKHSPNGAHHLTGAQAGTAYNNGWENHAEIQILNDGTIQGSLDGGVNWLNVDPTAVTRANAQTAEFLHQFRAQGNNAAAALGQPHHITDANVANYQKHSPNGAHHLTGAQAGTAYNNGWENHAEIRITNTNALEVNTGDGWNVYNPTLGGNTRANYIFLRAFRGAGGRANAAHGVDGHITDANVANYQKHSPNGAHHLTGAQAGTAYNNGWENHAEIQILNDGTIQGSLDGGVNWLNVDPTAVTRANAQTAEFLHQFRAQGNNAAAALGQPHHITDANVANYQKHSPNGAHHLTGAQAGTAYNNGWENHAEIQILNDGTIQGSLDGGVNWLNVDPTAVTRANAQTAEFLHQFRAQGNNAAAALGQPHHITDANVANYQKHSPNGAHHLTGAQAGTAYNNGWENHAEIRITNTNALEVNTGDGWNVYNPTLGGNTRANYIFLRAFRGAGGRANAAHGVDGHITDANVANYQKHSPNGAHHLTGAQAGTAYNNGWENHAEIQILNDGTIQGSLDGGVNWLNVDPTAVTRANAQTAEFLHQFRAQGNNAAAALGQPHHITDANVANYQKHSPNGAHHLTGAQAGTAYNNGWENHAEIQILNDGTIQGSLDGGVNWLNVDPTAVTRANAQTAEFLHQFRAQGNNAAAALGQPHHITDANVANYQKHSPNGAHHLTGAQAGTAYNNGWENHAEIRITNTNALEVNTGDGWNVYNPTLGGNTRANYIFLRAFRGAGGRANAAHGVDGHITDANVANYQKHSPNGAHHLTGAQAGTAYNNGWENHAEIQILNDGTIQGSLDGGVNWLNVDPTAVTRANAQTAEFLHQFRAQGNNAAAALGQPHHITDANVANYQKHSPNGAHHLTGAQAGTAYNNGWENHAEIQILNDGTIQGSLDGGVNWLNVDPTAVTRANAQTAEFLHQFRAQGNNAAAALGQPHHITDANVANYQKHSPNGAHHLTGAQAGTAYNNGWENHAEIQILNDGTIQGSLDGGVNWLNVDPTAVTRANAQTAEFLHQFRAQGNNAAAALGQPHHITDANVANYQKHSPNGAHHLTGAQAGTAYNNGWENHAEIQILNDGTIQGSLDGGVNWLNVDPTAVTRANAQTAEFLHQFRAQGNNAAAALGQPHHITDANVANYQKHSPNGAHHLTGAQAGTAYNNGWENHAEIRITNTNALEVNTGDGWNVYNPTLGGNTRANYIFLRAFRGAGGRANAAHGVDGHITDANVANYQKHSPNGAHHLTGAQAGTAYNNGWENHAEIQILNDGTIQGSLDGGVNWLNVDPTAVTRANAQTAEFLHQFRAQGNNAAAALGQPHHITDANVANYQKHSPNGAHHLTGAQAGTAYNNGWENHAEIQILNDGTIQGSLDGGVNWLNVDPTAKTRLAALKEHSVTEMDGVKKVNPTDKPHTCRISKSELTQKIVDTHLGGTKPTTIATWKWKDYLKEAATETELHTRKAHVKAIIDNTVQAKQDFVNDFQRVVSAGAVKEILTYFEKINKGDRAAEVYQVGIKATDLNNGSFSFEGKDYDFNGSGWTDYQNVKRLGEEAAAENQKYDEILSRIKAAKTEVEIEAETGNINGLDDNKLTSPRKKENLTQEQTTQKNKLAEQQRQTALQQAQNEAKSKDLDGNEWNPALTAAEIKQIEEANDLEAVKKAQEVIKAAREKQKESPKIPPPSDTPKQAIDKVVKKIQEVVNEEELEKIEKNGLDEKQKTIVDNLVERKKVCFHIKKDASISAENKTFLEENLVKLIPETIHNDQDEQKLTELEKKLKSFQTASESEEKGKIYQNSEYKKVIDVVLKEIQQEKQRYAQEKRKNTPTKEPSQGLPGWGIGLIVVGVVIGVTFLVIWLSRVSFEDKKIRD